MSDDEMTRARDALADALAYLKGVLTADKDAIAAARGQADPIALADALAFILIERSEKDELLRYIDKQQHGIRVQDALGNHGPFESDRA
jgi:hypothetical protein